MGQICVACRRQSVRPPMEHYTEVGSADSVAPYRSSLRRLLPGNILVTNKKICLNMNTVCTFDAGVRPQLLTLQCDRRNLLLTIIVCCTYWHCQRRTQSGSAFDCSSDCFPSCQRDDVHASYARVYIGLLVLCVVFILSSFVCYFVYILLLL